MQILKSMRKDAVMGKVLPAWHRPRLPPIPEEEEEEHEEGDGGEEAKLSLDGVESQAWNLFSELLLMMQDGAQRGDAVNDRTSNQTSSGVMRKVYNPVPEIVNGVSVPINNVTWKPRLPLIPEEEDMADTDTDGNGTGKEDKMVRKGSCVGALSGTSDGASDYVEAINEVLTLMSSSGAPQPASARDVMYGLRLPQIFEESQEESV